MLIAGETSGDRLAAELTRALRAKMTSHQPASFLNEAAWQTQLAPRFFGAGGPEMAEAGVDLALDMTEHSVIGLAEVLRKYVHFYRIFQRLLQLAMTRQPQAIIGVDFSGFNGRFARAVKQHVRSRQGPFNNWRPKLIQYVSPQVWASRPGRIEAMARDYDLVLSIFPFEKDWFARQGSPLRVDFVGHPILDRYPALDLPSAESRKPLDPPLIVLLPGSRVHEIRRHAGPMLGAAQLISDRKDVQFCVVVPSGELADRLEQHPRLRSWPHAWQRLRIRVGGLAESLTQASVAIASTGTVTMECALFGVPTVALYKTSWSTYQIGKRIVRIKHLAMPNILAGESLFPEFIQHQANSRNLAWACLELLDTPNRRFYVKRRLAEVIRSLGCPGATVRAADSVLSLFGEEAGRLGQAPHVPRLSGGEKSSA